MRYLTIFLLPVLLVAGCAAGRQAAIDLSEENVLNAEAMRQVARNCRSVIQMQIGFTETALGNRMDELSIEDVKALKELKQLAEKPELSDYEVGRFLGSKARLLGSVVQVALEKYAPDIGVMLPLVF